MNVTAHRYKRCDLLKPSGRIDAYTAPVFEEAINKLTGEGRYKIVVDMSDVDFLASRGLWILTEAQKECKRYNRGELVLVNLRDEIRDTLDLAGMGTYFKIYDDVVEAVGSF
jgi:anti-sigma B factor antagonist